MLAKVAELDAFCEADLAATGWELALPGPQISVIAWRRCGQQADPQLAPG